MSDSGSIAGWLVQTARGIHGPFANAGAAATYIDEQYQNLAAPFVLLPMHEPRTLPSKSIGDAIREAMRQEQGQRRLVPFDDGWSPSV